MSWQRRLRLESAVSSAVADKLRFSTIFAEGEPSDFFISIVTRREKVYKATLSPDPLGATTS